MNLNERNYWNNRTYGKAITIKKTWIVGILILLCLITPATNWMIPFLHKSIKTGITMRYGQ